MTSLSAYLRDSLKVTPLGNDEIEVTVTLTPDLLLHYIRLLEALSGFFRYTKLQAKYAQARSDDASEKYAKEAQQRIAEYRSLLVDLYDKHAAAGLDRKAAIKQVAADLRAEKHPWCCPDLVRSNLVAAGRRGRSGRPRSRS